MSVEYRNNARCFHHEKFHIKIYKSITYMKFIQGEFAFFSSEKVDG